MSKLTILAKQQLAVRSTRDVVPKASAMGNLFGSIANSQIPLPTNVDFIPEDADGNIIDVSGNVNPQWLGLQSKLMQAWAYAYCSPLASVIDRLAEADTNGRMELTDESGVTIKRKSWINSPAKKRVMTLMANPNPSETWEEYNATQLVWAKQFGYCPVLAITPEGMDKTYTKYMFNINPLFCNPIVEDNNSLFDPKPLIRAWRISIFGEDYEIPAEDILIIKDGFVGNSNTGLPLSKVAGLDYAISNICAAMEADNVLLKKKGPLGIFSHDPKPDMAGWKPLKNEEKDDIQRELKRYGLSWTQLQYVISKQPLKWNAMSFNLRDLMTKETARQGIDMICDRFAYPAELMSGKNATYENRTSAEKYMYQNNIIPFSIRRMSRYDRFFGFSDFNLYLNYDHLPVLQEDIVHAAQAFKSRSDGLLVEWTAGMITFNQWQEYQNRETITGMDIYYPEWAKKFGKDLQSLQPKQPKQIVK